MFTLYTYSHRFCKQWELPLSPCPSPSLGEFEDHPLTLQVVISRKTKFCNKSNSQPPPRMTGARDNNSSPPAEHVSSYKEAAPFRQEPTTLIQCRLCYSEKEGDDINSKLISSVFKRAGHTRQQLWQSYTVQLAMRAKYCSFLVCP